jgi:hypothetical protein
MSPSEMAGLEEWLPPPGNWRNRNRLIGRRIQKQRMTFVLIARIPAAGVDLFQEYEAGVLPLLALHRGQLERRLRNADGTAEIHLVSFASADDFEGFRADPRRAALAPILAQSGAVTELLSMADTES